jgi:hypothetical protein
MLLGDNWRRELKADLPRDTTELRLSHTRRVEDHDQACLLGQTDFFFGFSLAFLVQVASRGDAELERRLGETGETHEDQ